MRLLVTRPTEDARPLAASLAALGHTVIVDPLIEIVPTNASPPAVAPNAALIFTSANGVRAWRAGTDLPVHAVGAHTAATARAAGFKAVTSAEGDVQALAALIAEASPAGRCFLHVRGEAVSGDLAGNLRGAGHAVDEYIAYRAIVSGRLAAETVKALRARAIDGVLFYSPRSARQFAALLVAAALGDAIGEVVAYCLSRPIAAALAPLVFRDVAIAVEPNERSMLALLPAAA